VNVSQSTIGPACPAVLVSLLRPDNSQLGAPASTCGATAFLDTQTLDATGTWTIFVDPQGSNVGHLTLRAYAVSDQVGTIVRNGVPVSVSITTPGQNARFTFTSTAGQQVSSLLSSATFGKTCGAASVSLRRPDGSRLGNAAVSCKQVAFLDSLTLDVDGTWAILVDPQGARLGTANLSAFNTNDQTGLTHLDGTPFAIDLSSPGENAAIHFTGDAGQNVSAQIANATFAGCPAFVLSLVRPDGSSFGNTVDSCTAAAFLDAQTLDQTGVWSVLVDPQGKTTGAATLRAYDAKDDTGTADLSGKPAYVAFGNPGENARWTFSGTSGQHISAYVTQSTLSPCDFSLSLVRPDGSTLGTPVDSCSAEAFVDTQVLDQTGTWTALVDPKGPGTGSATLQVFKVTDTSMRFKPSPYLKTFTSLTPGTNARYRFDGTVGNVRNVKITDSTYEGCPSLVVSLVRPDSSVLTSKSTCTDAVTFTDVSLDAAGTWTLFIDPQGPATGTMIIHLT
jgi:hypothetical protein